MKIIIFGLGSIGQRHANILLKNYKHELFVFRSGINSKKNSLGIKEIYSWDEVENLKPDVAFITNPTSLHIETAIKCAEIGCKLFIEKPIGANLEGLDKLIKIIKKKKLVTYVAYNRRFNPVVVYLKKVLNKRNPLHAKVINTSYYPNWREGRNHLEAYSAKSKMGGGVLLDLSHDLDFSIYLFGNFKKIEGKFGKRGNVTVDSEDWADMTVACEQCPVNIHINIFSQLNENTIYVDFGNFSVKGNILEGKIEEYRNGKLTKKIEKNYYRNQSFEAQLKYFFKNIKNHQMMNNLLDAAPLFTKIIEFKNNE